jgi:hypothetical protein
VLSAVVLWGQVPSSSHCGCACRGGNECLGWWS